uniref:Uncharacterized protein n=1 Tax=Arundo donax TaxID=35708 RepID=A0A0A8ZPV9_ARUDO
MRNWAWGLREESSVRD